MIRKTKLSFVEMQELRASHVRVSDKVFVLLADKDEVEARKNLVKEYARYSNVIFFSDGGVFLDGRNRRCAIGWLNTPPIENYKKRKNDELSCK